MSHYTHDTGNAHPVHVSSYRTLGEVSAITASSPSSNGYLVMSGTFLLECQRHVRGIQGLI